MRCGTILAAFTEEIETIRGALGFAKTAEDSRSISLSVNVTYKGSC